MKTSFHFSRLILIAAVALITGSCFGKLDVPFKVNPSYVYVVQTQSEGTNYFTPVVGFTATSSSSKIASGDVLQGNNSLGGNVYPDLSMFETSFLENSTEILTDLNDDYTMKATDDKGKSAIYSFGLAFIPADVMNLGEGVEELDVSEFIYSSQTISAKITPVAQATHYLFFMVPVLPDNLNTPENGPEIRTLIYHDRSGFLTLDSNSKIAVSYSPTLAYDYWIYPAAARKTSAGIVLIFGEGKLLPHRATAFEELL